MIKKEKLDHPEPISNRYLMSKLVYRMIFDQLATFSIFGLFFIKGTIDQEREVRLFWNHFQSISHGKFSLMDDFRQICNIFDFRTLFPQGRRWSRKRSRIVLNPFPIDFWCQNWFINLEHFQFSDSFSSIFDFGLFFIKGADDQERKVGPF